MIKVLFITIGRPACGRQARPDISGSGLYLNKYQIVNSKEQKADFRNLIFTICSGSGITEISLTERGKEYLKVGKRIPKIERVTEEMPKVILNHIERGEDMEIERLIDSMSSEYVRINYISLDL